MTDSRQDDSDRYYEEVGSQQRYLDEAKAMFAQAAELAARLGGHPEAAASVERTLLTVANLTPEPAQDPRQKALFSEAA